ncbi:MAG: UvrD-helicase domain-containing protein [Bacteroidota bacterium]
MQYDLYSEDPGIGKTIIYRSSAGSGKTFALAKAYLKLVLLDPGRYHQVLAITFTNDAKDEMKTRIIEYLTSLADDENSKMRDAILEDFEKEGVERIEDVITPRAKTVLNSILHDYSRFNVSTIDHFFSQLIRHLAKELNLNLGYELDVDYNKALNESIDLLFAEADKTTLDWLKDFSLDQLDNDKGWDIRKNIAQLGKKLFHESYLDIEESLRSNVHKLKEFIQEQKQIVARFKKEVNALGKRGVEIASQHHLETEDFKKYTFSKIVEMSSSQYEFHKEPTKTFLEAGSVDKWHTKTSDKIEAITEAYEAGLKDVHQDLVMFYTGNRYLEFLEARAIMIYIHSYGVLSKLSEKLYQYRSTNNLVLISDTAFILNKAISDIEMPFIYERIGAKYQYILIDEFQDTSRYQWKSLLPFFKNAVADGGQLFIVGDVKQSIYGWRGGDMKLLLHEVEKDLDLQPDSIRTLNTNYRSCQNIVNFNNAFFKIVPEILPESFGLEQFQSDFKKAYHDVEQNIDKSCEGNVHFKFFNKTEEHSWKELALEETIKTIQIIQQDGFSLSEILILTRKNDDARLIAKTLLENNIPAISEEALMVNSSSKVKLLVSALKFMANPEDKLAIAEFNFFSNEIHRTENQFLTVANSHLQNLNELNGLSLFDAVEELILLLNLNKVSDIYIQQFLDICLAQSKKGNTIHSFLEWWDEEKSNDQSKDMAVALPATQDAIEIKTVHKAKGLQKTIVMIPLADYLMPPRANNTVWTKPTPDHYKEWGSLPLSFNKDLSKTRFESTYFNVSFDNTIESLNLLYVAFTRAIERLYVYSSSTSQKSSAGSLIKTVLSNSSFIFNDQFNGDAEEFTLGEPGRKAVSGDVEATTTKSQHLLSSTLSEKISIDQKQSKLFLSYEGEKSEKVKEGLALHLTMSLIDKKESVAEVLRQLEVAQIVSKETCERVAVKIDELFLNIPQFKDWFSGSYEVLNERSIFANGHVYIPDRVMIKGKHAIIIDYKREQQDPKHHKQVKNYGALLKQLGYETIEMYLVYTMDQKLVEVL